MNIIKRDMLGLIDRRESKKKHEHDINNNIEQYIKENNEFKYIGTPVETRHESLL